MKIGYFSLEKLGDNGKVLRHDLVCQKCGQIVNIDDFVRERSIAEWDERAKMELWDWIEEQMFHCEHYLKWLEEEAYWDDEWVRHQNIFS